MNWYKQIKLALPIEERDQNFYDMFGIGHSKDEDITWWIDRSWELHTGREAEYGGHLGMPGYSGYDSGDFIAKGRYETPTQDHDGEVSAVLSASIKLHQVDYTTNRVEKILDSAFNNSRIIFFELPSGVQYR